MQLFGITCPFIRNPSIKGGWLWIAIPVSKLPKSLKKIWPDNMTQCKNFFWFCKSRGSCQQKNTFAFSEKWKKGKSSFCLLVLYIMSLIANHYPRLYLRFHFFHHFTRHIVRNFKINQFPQF